MEIKSRVRLVLDAGHFLEIPHRFESNLMTLLKKSTCRGEAPSLSSGFFSGLILSGGSDVSKRSHVP
jgi:hypothetical protein